MHLYVANYAFPFFIRMSKKSTIMLLEAVILILLLLSTYVVMSKIIYGPKLSPGPRPIPFLGNIAEMKTFNHVSVMEWTKKYGAIYTLKFLGSRIIIVNDIDLAKEALIHKGNVFAGRKKFYVSDQLSQGNGGIIFGDFGPTWKALRKIAHSALRMYGSGLNNLENKICVEIKEVSQHFCDLQGQPFDPRNQVQVAILNVMCSFVFGERFKGDDQEFQEIMQYLDAIMNLAAAGTLLEVFPFMRYLPLEIHNKITECQKLQAKVIRNRFEEHRQTYQEGTIRDLSDALLGAFYEYQQEDSKLKDLIREGQLVTTIAEVFAAGNDTTMSVLSFSLLYFTAFPEVQARAQQEMDDVIGRGRLPSLKDKPHLPYMEAVMVEILRHTSIAFETVPHRVRSDTTLGGYDIPQDSVVIFHLRGIHFDPSRWEKPEEFNPERFLDENGCFISPGTLSFLPFSAGPRVCLGETFAKTEIFLFQAQLLHQFKFECPPGSSPPDLEAFLGESDRGVLMPKPYQVIVTKRD